MITDYMTIWFAGAIFLVVPIVANGALRAAGERMAINMPIQGTAADIVKIAMIRMDRALRDGGFRARVLLSVHDELLIEAPRDEVERLMDIARQDPGH